MQASHFIICRTQQVARANMKPIQPILSQPLCILLAALLLMVQCTTRRAATGHRYSLQEVADKTLIPEGIAVHPTTGRVYLSSLHKAKIVAVDAKGAVTDVIATGQGGFLWGLGMKFSADGHTLWACSADGKGSTALFAINHRSGTIIKRYTADSARFLNDLVILPDGRIVATDTEQSALFVLAADSLHLLLKHEQLKWANGITATPDGSTLFVASGQYGVQTVDLATKAIRSATDGKRIDYAIDGLVWHGRSLYAAIGWPQDIVQQHRILRYQFDEAFRYRLADTLSIAQPWLQCPTTLALHSNRLYALSTMSLGLYNRHGQKTEAIMDSLQKPVIAVFNLPRE